MLKFVCVNIYAKHRQCVNRRKVISRVLFWWSCRIKVESILCAWIYIYSLCYTEFFSLVTEQQVKFQGFRYPSLQYWQHNPFLHKPMILRNFENLLPERIETGVGLWLSFKSMWDTVFGNDLVSYIFGWQFTMIRLLQTCMLCSHDILTITFPDTSDLLYQRS